MKDLQSMLGVLEGLSSAVGISLWVRKCVVAYLRVWRARQLGGTTSRGGEIKEQGKRSYHYLGEDQVFGLRSKETKDRIVQEYVQRG